MLHVTIDEKDGIAILEPTGALSEQDFTSAAGVIDPFIEGYGDLNGIIIRVRKFPGWDSFGALIAHLRFIRDLHRKVARLAFVTDSPIGDLAQYVGGHFVHAEIREFPFDELDQATQWVLTGTPE